MKLHIGRVQSMLAQPLNYLALFRELFVCFMTAMQAALESTIEEGENEAVHLLEFSRTPMSFLTVTEVRASWSNRIRLS